MGRDDDSADAPRRVPSASSTSGGGGNGNRAKRPAPPPTGGLKYDPTMAPPHHGHHHPHHVYAAPGGEPLYGAAPVYAPNDGYHHHQPQHYAPPPPQHPLAPAPYATEPGSTASNKRKRVKKERDDDWAPAAPPPPAMAYASDSAAHMAMPTILHRSSSSTMAATVAPPTQYKPAYATPPPPTGPHTIFSEAPVVIESFAERRANAASNASNVSTGGSALDVGRLVHRDQTSSAASSPKSSSNGSSSMWATRTTSNGTMSVYDVFFPASTRTKDAGGSSSAKNGSRESKRRRRNNGDAADRSSSTRATNRRASTMGEDTSEVDMLRFTVDSFKLIPQGLVDRIDVRLHPKVVTTLIASHVENWVKRAGFDDHNFLQEITTLLNVYYPCTHPMILDEVLVAFIFKRPELMKRMLTSIVERLQKNGESANPSKYPVIETFTKRCGAAQRGGILKKDTARHDLACLTVLRFLLERNTEKFMLSPWIAACASFCSDEVLDLMWEALLRPLVSNGKSSPGSWSVHDPLDQIFELLREEKQVSRNADGGSCKLSMSLIKKVVLDDAYSDMRSAPVTCEAFEIFFGRNTNSAPLISAWLTYEKGDKLSDQDSVTRVMHVMIENCARLSVKKTNWFIRHMLSFVLSTSSSRIFGELVLDHAGLLLGGVDKVEIDEIQVLENNKSGKENARQVIVGKVTSNEKNTTAGVIAQLNVFLAALRAIPGKTATSVVQAWSEKWCAPEVLLPWSYVWSVVSSAITIRPPKGIAHSSVDATFYEFASCLVKHYVGDLLAREDATKYLPRIVLILKLTTQHVPDRISTKLLECVLDAVARLPKSSPLVEKAINVVATTFAEQISTNGAMASPAAIQGVKTDRKPLHRVALLYALDTFVSREDAIGRFVRDQVLLRRRLSKIILQVLNDGNDEEAMAAVKIMQNVVDMKVPVATGPQDMWTTSAIESVVALCYRVRLPGTRRDAIALLHTISQDNGVCKSLLWTVLNLCTSYCCGCSVQSQGAALTVSNQQLPDAALALADLTTFVLKRVPRDVVTDVGEYIHQHIRSCGPLKAQWNLFLVVVLDRVVQLGWNLLAAAPKLVQVVLSPFDVMRPSSDPQDCTAQLRSLKSLCLVILIESSSKRSPSKTETWLPVARILGSDQLASKLKSIVSHNSSSTAVSLSLAITALCKDIKQNIDLQNPSTVAVQAKLMV